MRESRPPGSVRGAPGDGRPYRDSESYLSRAHAPGAIAGSCISSKSLGQEHSKLCIFTVLVCPFGRHPCETHSRSPISIGRRAYAIRCAATECNKARSGGAKASITTTAGAHNDGHEHS